LHLFLPLVVVSVGGRLLGGALLARADLSQLTLELK
jgi:hypothetical protein